MSPAAHAPAPGAEAAQDIGRLGPDGTERRWFVFRTPGDTISGRVVGYHPTRGARTHDGDPCGCIVVEADRTGEQVRVGLDKDNLSGSVYALHPRPGMRLSITFTAWAQSQRSGRRYKRFRAEETVLDNRRRPHERSPAGAGPGSGGHSVRARSAASADP